MSCKHGNYEGINGRDCDLCDAEDEIWKICAAKDVEIADLKAAYESLFKENAARRAAALASPAPSVGEPVADPLQGAADWLKSGLVDVTVADIQSRLLIGYNRARRLFDGATPPAAPAATEAPTKPFAYYIHIAAEQRGEFVHNLDEALDDLTNCDCKITELFDHATPAPAVGASDWWRKRADEIELQVARSGSTEAMRCFTDMRTLLQSATAPASVQPVLASLSDEQILALNQNEQFFSESPSKYPEAGHGTQYHAGAPGVVGFARAVLALASSTPTTGDAS